jgi:hypothetical protein
MAWTVLLLLFWDNGEVALVVASVTNGHIVENTHRTNIVQWMLHENLCTFFFILETGKRKKKDSVHVMVRKQKKRKK